MGDGIVLHIQVSRLCVIVEYHSDKYSVSE